MKTNEIIRALLDSDEDDLDMKDLERFSEEELERQFMSLLSKAVVNKENYLGLHCVSTTKLTNSKGETYLFGRFGRRKPNSCTSTLLYLSPEHEWQLVESIDDTDEFKDVYEVDPEPIVYLSLGSVSSGTMRTDSLIPSFLSALSDVDPKAAQLYYAEYENRDEDPDFDEDYFCWETLTDALEEHTPPYTYFGSNEGDGADYGVWVSTESIEDDLRYEDTEKLQAIEKGEPMPTGSQYVVVRGGYGDYEKLLDGTTGEEIWAI